MAPPLPNRHLIVMQAVERLERNWSLERIAAMPGMPSRQTLYRWGKALPSIAQQMADARARCRGELREAFRIAPFDPALAEAFLDRVRAGERVTDLVRRPEWPHREWLDRWKAEQPGFAAALKGAVAEARRARTRRAPGTRAQDAVLLRVIRGEPVRKVQADAGMPGRHKLQRWREADPDFAAAYDAAKRTAQRRRMRARSKCTPQLVEAIVERIRLGDSLHSLAQRPGMPHHVTLYGWIRSRPEFAAAVRRACADREDILFEQRLMRVQGASPAAVSREMARIGAVERRVMTMPRWPGGPARDDED